MSRIVHVPVSISSPHEPAVVCIDLDVHGLNWLIELIPEGDSFRDYLLEARHRVGQVLTEQYVEPLSLYGVLNRKVTTKRL